MSNPTPNVPKLHKDVEKQLRDMQILAATGVGIFVLIVLFVWSCVVFSLAGFHVPFMEPASAATASLLLGVTIALGCFFLWWFHHLSVYPIQDKQVVAGIWTVLIVAVLGTASGAIASVWKAKVSEVDAPAPTAKVKADKRHDPSTDVISAP